MNLLDIIFFSLKLFGAVAFIIVGISFAVYKLKSASRLNKKETLAPVIENVPEIIIPEIENYAPPVRPIQKRFVILNEINGVNPVGDNLHDSIAEEYPAKNINSLNQDKPLNIFSRYSNNSFEPMHKIKL